MRSIILLGVLVVCMSTYVLADVCGGLDCGKYSCCLDQSYGPLCYSSSNYSCVQLAGSKNKLCPYGEQVCGMYCYGDKYVCDNGMLCPAGMLACGEGPSNFACYDATEYSCLSGKLLQGGNGATSAPPTASPSTHAPTASPSTHSPTASPSTHSPTASPSTQSPSTKSPSTSAPTSAPSTHSPTASPSTASPSTHAPTVAPSTSSPSTSSGKVSVKLWGIDYNPRTATDACPSLADVEQDLEILETVTSRIRLYSIDDCGAAQLILQAIHDNRYDLTVTLGIWLDQYYSVEFADEYAALESLINGIGLDHVDAIIVGSETQYRGNFSPSLLISFLQNVSSTVHSAGYSNIQVATADVIYNLLGGASSVLRAEDVVYVNQFPYWEGVDIADAPARLESTVSQLQSAAGNKPIIISETGWPTCGQNYGAAAPGLSNLETNLQDMVCYFYKNNIGYFWFSAFDEPWANATAQGGVETCFGLFTADKQLKSGITLPVQCPQ